MFCLSSECRKWLLQASRGNVCPVREMCDVVALDFREAGELGATSHCHMCSLPLALL